MTLRSHESALLLNANATDERDLARAVDDLARRHLDDVDLRVLG